MYCDLQAVNNSGELPFISVVNLLLEHLSDSQPLDFPGLGKQTLEL